MSDLEHQQRFVHLLAQLFAHAWSLGYELTLGEAWVPPAAFALQVATGRRGRKSFHPRRLAIDLCLFRDGVYLTRTDDYLPLGVFWESIGGTWGGRFRRPDGNHFSLGE